MKIFFTICLLTLMSVVKSQSQCDARFIYTIDKDKVVFMTTGYLNSKKAYWNFGDGNTAVVTNGKDSAFNTYNPGNYTVKHVIIDSVSNCTDSVEQVISIVYPVTCKASISVSHNFFAGNEMIFSGYTSSVSGNGSISEYTWKIDGESVWDNVTLIDSLSPGLHQVCLSIVATNGCSNSICDTINVKPLKKCNSQKTFVALPTQVNAKEFHFSINPELPVFKYNWDFGDGQYVSDSSNPIHSYLKSGTYPVTLYAFDSVSRFCLDTIKQNVVVHSSAADSCVVSFNYTIQNSQVTFTPVSNQPIASVWWMNLPLDSSKYNVNSALNPVFEFIDTGYYYVCLQVTTTKGCTAQYCQTVKMDNPSNHRQANAIPSAPNPATNMVRLSVQLAEAAQINYTVYNNTGVPVFHQQAAGLAGANTINVDLHGLAKGQYFIDILYGKERKYSIVQKL